MSDRSFRVDAHVAIAGGSPRGSVQCADILLSNQPSRRAARRWITTALAEHPECVVLAARHARGRWCLLATRGAETLLVHSDRRSTVDITVAELFARARYVRWIAEVWR